MITIFLIVMLIIGVRIKLSYEMEESYFSLNVIIFGGIYVLRLRLKIIDGFLNFSINNGRMRRVTLPPPSREKVETVIPSLPKITLHNARFYVRFGVESAITSSVVSSTIKLALLYLKHSNKIVLKNSSLNVVTDFGDDVLKLNVDFTLKFALLKIIFFVLRIIIGKRKKGGNYGTQSDRRTDVEYTR